MVEQYKEFLGFGKSFLELLDQPLDHCQKFQDVFEFTTQRISLPRIRKVYNIDTFENELELKYARRNYTKLQLVKESYFLPWREDQIQILRNFVEFVESTESDNRIFSIQAIFGAGKTTLIKAMITMLVLNEWENEVYYDANRILVTAYNKSIEESMKVNLKPFLKTIIDQYRTIHGIKIKTYDSIIFEIAKNLKLPLMMYGNPFEDRRKLVYNNIDKLNRVRNSLPLFIFVDEAQDLSRESLEVLLLYYPKSKIIICGDSFQSIAREPSSSLLYRCINETNQLTKEIILQDAKRISYKNFINIMYITPRVPLRILEEVKEAFLLHYGDNIKHERVIECWKSENIEQDDGIEWITHTSFRETINQIINIILDSSTECNEGNTMILVYTADLTSSNNFGDIGRVREELRRKNMQFNYNFKKEEVGKIFLTTMSSSKGLERDFVYIIIKDNIDNESLTMTRDIVLNTICVGISRAKRKLSIFYGKNFENNPLSLKYFKKYRDIFDLGDGEIKTHNQDVASTILRTHNISTIKDILPMNIYNRLYYIYKEISKETIRVTNDPNLHRLRARTRENQIINARIYARFVEMNLKNNIETDDISSDEEGEDNNDDKCEYEEEYNKTKSKLKEWYERRSFETSTDQEKFQISKLKENLNIIKKQKSNLWQIFPSDRHFELLDTINNEVLYSQLLVDLIENINSENCISFFMKKFQSDVFIHTSISILYYKTDTRKLNLFIIDSSREELNNLLGDLRLTSTVSLLCFLEKNKNFCLTNHEIKVTCILLYRPEWISFTLKLNQQQNNRQSTGNGNRNLYHDYHNLIKLKYSIRNNMLFHNLKSYFSKEYSLDTEGVINVRNLYYLDGLWSYSEIQGEKKIIWEEIIIIKFLGPNEFDWKIIRGNKIEVFFREFFENSFIEIENDTSTLCECEAFFIDLFSNPRKRKLNENYGENTLKKYLKDNNIKSISDLINFLRENERSDFHNLVRECNSNTNVLEVLDYYIDNFTLDPKAENLKKKNLKKVILSNCIPRSAIYQYDLCTSFNQENNSFEDLKIKHIGVDHYIKPSEKAIQLHYLNEDKCNITNINDIISNIYGTLEDGNVVFSKNNLMDFWKESYSKFKQAANKNKTIAEQLEKHTNLYFFSKKSYIDRSILQLCYLKKKWNFVTD